MAKLTSIKPVEPNFDDVKSWFNEHMHPSKIDFDDQRVYENVYHSGRWAGIFQCTSQGAQRFFVKAKPRSIIDIASLTSIYRPGPLSANVDKLWLQHEDEPYDWGHPLINETLKETRGLLVFQEGVMALANKVGGFPLDQTDEVRRAIMKRSISGGEAAKKAAQELEDGFVSGAMKNGVPESIAKKAYQTILWMSGYGFNKSHAVAYAIDSYWCAWLMTHYEEEWLIAYLESMSNNPESRAKAFSEVRSLGYQIVDIDINHATEEWTALPGRKLMPSFLSCKGIGMSAIEEIKQNRPYTSIEGLLWNDDGTWRHGKFNRKAFEALIKIGAFESMDLIGEGKMFSSYRHMWESLMGSHTELVKKRKGDTELTEVTKDHAALIKRSTKADPHEGRKNFYELARGLRNEVGEWTAEERVEIFKECFGTVDATLLIDRSRLQRLEEKGVRSIDEYEDVDIYWFVITDCTMKKTKNGKTYALIKAMGPVGKEHRLNVWGAKQPYKLWTTYLAEVSANDFGKSTTAWKMKQI